MKVAFAPLPSLLEGSFRKAEIDVREDEPLSAALRRARFLLSLWLHPVGGSSKEWVVLKGEGVRVDVDRFTPADLHLQDGSILYVALEDRIPSDLISREDPQIPTVNILGGVEPDPAPLPPDVLTEADIISYEEQMRLARERAQKVEEEHGVKASYQKIFHDEAVDDYEEEEFEELDDIVEGGLESILPNVAVGGDYEEYDEYEDEVDDDEENQHESSLWSLRNTGPDTAQIGTLGSLQPRAPAYHPRSATNGLR